MLQGLDVVRGAWEWRLIFDTVDIRNLSDEQVVVPDGVDLDDVGAGLCISRDATDTWTFNNGCTATDLVGEEVEVDNDVELWHVDEGVFTLVAVITMPFSFEVTGG